MAAPSQDVAVLVVSPEHEDIFRLRRILDECWWKWEECGGRAEALAILRDVSVALVFCESCLPDGSWRDVVRVAAEVSEPPKVVVCSRLADDELWLDALDAGAFDVLRKPYYAPEARRVALTAAKERGHAVPYLRPKAA